MIQPHELMIGNYVIFSKSEMLEDEKYQEVKELLKDECVTQSNIFIYSHCNYSDLQPIPLNKEWLIKFGYEGYNMLSNHYWKRPIRIYKQDDIYWIDILDDSLEIVYVHQLQNLYLSLTGEQLKIKEDA